MSGHFTPLLLGLGGVSVALVTWLAARMRIVDREGLPVQHGLAILPYGVWLLREVVTSSLAIARTVTARELEIQPQVFTVKGLPHDAVAQTLYANSITLTPGTVTLDVDDQHLLIHALTNHASEGLHAGEMRRRVAQAMHIPDTEGPQ